MWKYFVDHDSYVWTLNTHENCTPYPCHSFIFVEHSGYVGIEFLDKDGFVIDEFVLHDSLLDLAKILEP